MAAKLAEAPISPALGQKIAYVIKLPGIHRHPGCRRDLLQGFPGLHYIRRRPR